MTESRPAVSHIHTPTHRHTRTRTHACTHAHTPASLWNTQTWLDVFLISLQAAYPFHCADHIICHLYRPFVLSFFLCCLRFVSITLAGDLFSHHCTFLFQFLISLFLYLQQLCQFLQPWPPAFFSFSLFTAFLFLFISLSL